MNKILLVLLFIIVIYSIVRTSLRYTSDTESYRTFYNVNIITMDAKSD